MGVDAEELIIQPFREVVRRGNEALSNAECLEDDLDASDVLAKAARALVREGERAWKRLRPIWDGQVDKYGDLFKDAMMEQDSIEEKRRLLEDLLYDFEDYIEPHTFDADRFTELQAATKALALDVIDLMRRLKLEAPKIPEPPVTAFPPLPPLPPGALGSPARIRPSAPPKGPPSDSKRLSTPVPPVPLPLAPRGLGLVRVRDSVEELRRAGTMSSSKPNTPQEPKLWHGQHLSSPDTTRERLDRRQISTLPHNRHTDSPPPTPPTPSWLKDHSVFAARPQPILNKGLPEDNFAPEPNDSHGPTASFLIPLTPELSSPDASAAPSVSGSIHGSVIADSAFSNSTSIESSPAKEPVMVPSPLQIRAPRPAVLPSESPGSDIHSIIKFKPVPPLPPISIPSATTTAFDDGLMLAEEAKTKSDANSMLDMPCGRGYSREADCCIGPKSSFRQLRGFCRGAEAFRIGGHWRGIKQQAGYVAQNRQSFIGRCVGCGYAHSFEELKLDIDKTPEASFSKAGVRFRLRFLYKSHISNSVVNQRQAESFYGCLFCVQTGSTVREGDATVFASPESLLLHLARHPQPLPPVPGVTVLYGNVPRDDIHAQDFDLHLAGSPLPTPVPQTIGRLAVATAVRDQLQRYGAKRLPAPPGFGGDLLPFAAGARIVGITFPTRWEGRWAMGWHDGVSGAFPAKSVEVEPPRESEIPMESTSGMSVAARWKWKPKRQGGRSVWLEFDKGETITNVRCLYADHWCWSGTNSKGKFGVFPQSHIVLKSLQQEPFRLGKPPKSRGLFSRRPMSSSVALSLDGSTGGTNSSMP